MTTAASPFSFHCMICFEEFHADNRFPVVLPCGHSYVCNVCGDRLDKCMECRFPLFVWTVPPPIPPQKLQQQAPNCRTSYSPGSRYGASHKNQLLPTGPKPPVPPQKTRLPLPKNVVLLSLMEATELTTELGKPSSPRTVPRDTKAETARDSSSPLNNLADSDEDNSDQDDVDEEQKIREGTLLALSSCGTYVVTARDGLLIFPSRPANASLEEDVDTLVRFFHLDTKIDSSSKQMPPPGQLSYGDRVQIVSMDGGWAKLARGYGFVQSHGIVKVGGSVDRACKLEAMLHSLSVRRKALRRDQSKVDSRFVILMNELQTSLLNDEDLTVIVGEAFTDTNTGEEDLNEEERDNTNEGAAPVTPKHQEPQQHHCPEKVSPTTSLVNIDLSRPIALSRQETPQALVQTSSLGCGLSSLSLPGPADLSPSSSREQDSQSSQQQRPPPPPRSPSTVNQSQMSAGARAWRERHGRQAAKGIDFRTGMSGHTGLLSTHSHPHQYLTNRETRNTFLGMSNHTGLSMYKSVRKAPSFPPDG